MKNRIEKLFQRKSRNILSVYFTAGYPELNDTVNIIRYLDEAGADMIEIGIPFSDPVADGPVIQNSSRIAIRKGMTLDLLFSQLEYIRRYTGIPLLLMGYMNPVLQFGEEKFIKTCIDTGIDGVIIPDMPPEYFAGKLRSKYRSAGLFNILLISSDTTNERIHMIDKLSNGFIYMVSPGATTGGLLRPEPAKAYFSRIAQMNLRNPLLAGFGINDKKSFSAACIRANGAITGTAFIKHLGKHGVSKEAIQSFINRFGNDYSTGKIDFT